MKFAQVSVSHVALWRLFVGLLATVVISGCTSTTPLVIDDSKVFHPSARVAVNLKDGKMAASEPQAGHAIE